MVKVKRTMGNVVRPHATIERRALLPYPTLNLSYVELFIYDITLWLAVLG